MRFFIKKIAGIKGSVFCFKKCRIQLVGGIFFISIFFSSFSSAQLVGPVSIQWIKVCGSSDWVHNYYVIGLSNGAVVEGMFNPSQGRSSTFTMLMAEYSRGNQIYYENAVPSGATICNVQVTHRLDPGANRPESILIGNPG